MTPLAFVCLGRATSVNTLEHDWSKSQRSNSTHVHSEQWLPNPSIVQYFVGLYWPFFWGIIRIHFAFEHCSFGFHLVFQCQQKGMPGACRMPRQEAETSSLLHFQPLGELSWMQYPVITYIQAWFAEKSSHLGHWSNNQDAFGSWF